MPNQVKRKGLCCRSEVLTSKGLLVGNQPPPKLGSWSLGAVPNQLGGIAALEDLQLLIFVYLGVIRS